MVDLSDVTEYVLPRTDLYHEEHPLHHLVLDEIEDYDEQMTAYERWRLTQSALTEASLTDDFPLSQREKD